MESIKDVVRSSVKVPESDDHLKMAGGLIVRNVVEITITMKTIVRKPLMIGFRSYGNQTRPIKWNAVSSRLRSFRYCCMDALLGRWLNGGRRSSTAIIQECCEQYWTGPGRNTPLGSNCTAYYHLSRKLYKLDEPDMLEKQKRDRKWCAPVEPRIWPIKSRTTSSNIHTAAMWLYGM